MEWSHVAGKRPIYRPGACGLPGSLWVARLPDIDSPAPAALVVPRPRNPAACNMVLQLARLVPSPIWRAVLRFPPYTCVQD